ncbi:hypothetical protein [Candidatus Pseudothioglobus sp. Uisw_086]|uniref:hypothetical protein n=1 Tax=Candidatus Pseudothioglobus sp. Uisw_086 TaxID=3230998 RepID=UPI003A88F85B
MKAFNKVSIYLRNPHILLLVSLTILSNVLVLSNILQSDYFGDDLYNFQLSGLYPYHYSGPEEYSLVSILGWMQAGRFFPFAAAYLIYIFTWFDTLFSYKLAIVSLILISNFLFSYFIYLFSKKNVHLALLVLLITPALFQYKLYHDPILSFHGYMPFIFSFLIISSIFLLKYLQINKKLYLIISVLSYTVTLGMYEIVYPFLLMYALIIVSQLSIRTNTKYFIRTLLPYFCVLIVAVMGAIYSKWFLCGEICITINNNPYMPNWDLLLILKTYFLQTLSVLPTTYYFNFGRFPHVSDFGGNFLILAILLIYVFFFSFKHKEGSVQGFNYILVLALLLLFLPGILISLSTKFQGLLGEMNKVQFGLPYIPIYLQTFGLSLLISLLISKVSKTMSIIFIMIGLGVVWTIHTVSNNQVISSVNAPYKDTREVLTLFFSSDFKDKLKNGDFIRLDGDNPFTHTDSFVPFVTKKDIKMARSDDDPYIYRISFEVAKDLSFINVYDTNLEKNFFFVYKKISNVWTNDFNEYAAGKENANVIPPFFNNFYPWEGQTGEFRWATKNPSMRWINPSNADKAQKLLFEITSLNARDLIISLNDSKVIELSLEEGKSYEINENISLQPGTNIIKFITKELPVNPPGADSRLLLFSLGKVHPFYSEGL